MSFHNIICFLFAVGYGCTPQSSVSAQMGAYSLGPPILDLCLYLYLHLNLDLCLCPCLCLCLGLCLCLCRIPSLRGTTIAIFLIWIFEYSVIPHSRCSIVFDAWWAPFRFHFHYFWHPRVALGIPGAHLRNQSRKKR